jgi:hypothetical protein
MREPSEEGSKRIFTRDCPINARKGTAAMDVSNEGKAKQRKGSIWLCRVNRGPSALDNKRHATWPPIGRMAAKFEPHVAVTFPILNAMPHGRSLRTGSLTSKNRS